MHTKIRILTFVFLALFLALVVRLFYWQVVKGKELSGRAKNQYSTSTITKAPRGNILSSDGSPWVARTQAWLVWANPKQLEKTPKEVAVLLASFFVDNTKEGDISILDTEEDRLTGLLSKKSTWVALKPKVSDNIKRNIEALGITGIYFDSQEASYYPEASSAAQLLGFVGKNDEGSDIGYFGLEGYYNLPLSGKSGFSSGEKDALGAPILLGGSTQISAVSGVDLETTIDKRIQNIIEKGLVEGVEKYGAQGGSVTIMDPKNGKILAIANYPSFDPSDYSKYNDSLFKNPVISDTFEPGSIFKVIVVAAGLDAGVIRPDTKCDICGAPLKLDKYFIKTWNNQYTQDISMTDVIVHSDNVGMSFIGQRLGAEKLYDYLKKFGIGEKTGIDLQGEVAPKMRERGTWNVVDLATASFGQGIAVTGIEMIRAVSVVANGGYLVSPHVVSTIKGSGWQEEVKTDKPVRIISSEAARETTQMMVEAVSRGEAKWCAIPGYSVAGKTGTAQIPVEGHYDETNTIHSFIGFAPAENPKFIMLVTLRTPQTSPWAAETAAPLWFTIARDLFPYLGIAPSE